MLRIFKRNRKPIDPRRDVVGSTIRIDGGGYVKLVDFMGSDEDVVRDARVSYNAQDKTGLNPERDNRLIKYLGTNKHTSPFEGAILKFEVELPIFLCRQWMRHRTWSFNEVSGRYTELDEHWFVPRFDKVTMQSKVNKQSRTDEIVPDAEDIIDAINDSCADSFYWYHYLLSKNCPRELARTVLPLGTMTKFVGTVNLHNLTRFIHLRDHEDAQAEIQEYAKAVHYFAEKIFPESMKWL